MSSLVTPYMTFATFASASPGSQAWTNPSNAHLADSSNAVATGTPQWTSQTLKCTGLENLILSKFSSVLIKGIGFRFIGSYGDPTDFDAATVYPVKAGTIDTGNGMAVNQAVLFSFDFGGEGTLFNQGWTLNDILSSGFGIGLQVHQNNTFGGTCNVDQVKCRIYYEPRLAMFFF